MLEEIRQALATISLPFSDPRRHVCKVEVTQVAEGCFDLSGEVLDGETYLALADGLLDRFPTLCFDGSQLAVLQAPDVPRAFVATNLTSLHVAPSFKSEQLTQMTCGQQMQVLQSDGQWGLVRLSDGYLGRTYLPYLQNGRPPEATHIVTVPQVLVRANPAPGEEIIGRLWAGTSLSIEQWRGDWAWIQLGRIEGWLPRAEVREISVRLGGQARREQMLRDAASFVGVPYLWGGTTPLGIDCSGLAQLLHRLVGITLPRDADWQYDAGEPVTEPYRPGDLFFFSESGDGRSITHVGVCVGGWRMVHSSRASNGVYYDDISVVDRLKRIFAGARRFLD
jgi:SH3-like domain-containing protein